MTRLTTIIGLLVLLLTPLNAAAFWLTSEGQCFEQTAGPLLGPDFSEPQTTANCDEDVDPTDPSSNVCFEAAGNPISTLPQMIAETQAERVVAAVLKRATATPTQVLVPSPSEASVEDPAIPGRQLVERIAIPKPRSAPNACSVYPEDCERAPWTPTLNLDGSVPQANDTHTVFEVRKPGTLESRLGPPAEGLGPSIGIFVRLDRPPQVG